LKPPIGFLGRRGKTILILVILFYKWILII